MESTVEASTERGRDVGSARPAAQPLVAQGQPHKRREDHDRHNDDPPSHCRLRGVASSLALLGNTFGAATLVASLGTVWLYGGVWDFSTSYATDESVSHFENAIVMLIPAMILEGAHLLSSSVAGARLTGFCFGVGVVVQIGVKFCCYSAMWMFHGGVVHCNLRSPDARPVYTVRYIDWAFAVPALAAMNSLVFDTEKCPLKAGEATQVAGLLWGAFCFPIAAWVGQVTPSSPAGWLLVTLALAGYVLQSVQQALIVHERLPFISHARFKVVALLSLELYTACYSAVLMLGNAGIISSWSEQMFFTYVDVLLKTTQVVVLLMIRNWDELDRVAASLRHQIDRSREDMANFVERASVPIVCLSTEGIVLGWNQQMAVLTSMDEEAAKGKPLTDFVAKDCCEDLESALRACSGDQSTNAVELRLALPAKQEATATTLTMNFIAQLGADAANSSIVGVGQDLTELIASKALQERRARFAAVVSHELRSPLHGITGLSRAMAEAATGELEKKQLGMINGCANRLLDLVSNIMDKSAIDKESEVGLERQASVNLLDILDEVICMMQAAVDKSGRRILKSKVSLQNEMTMQSFPLVVGDPYKCTQVFYNLVVNACKFTNEGSVAVSARRCGDFVEVDVADTGCGIAPDALQRIFNPFEQETSSDCRSFQGIGLGLSVARGIVRLHRGEIKVRSEKGVGSTFTVRLPCQAEEVSRQYPAVQQEENVSNQDAKEKAPGHGLKPRPEGSLSGRTEQEASSQSLGQVDAVPSMSDLVSEVSRHLTLSALPTIASGEKPLLLSVDDDEVNHFVIERNLSQNFRIIKAMDGMEAIEYLKSGKERPSVVLLDIMMPGMTGFDVVREIRSSMNLGHFTLPVIMLSARSPPDETALQALRCGATEYMAKPFNAKMLHCRLKNCISIRRDCLALYSIAQREAKWDEDAEELSEAKEEILRLQDELSRVNSEADWKMEQTRQELEGRHVAAVEMERSRVEELQSQLTRTRADTETLREQLEVLEKERARIERRPSETRAVQTVHVRVQPLEPDVAEFARLSSSSSFGGQGSITHRAEQAVFLGSSMAREARWLRHELELARGSVEQLSAKLAHREAEARALQHRSNSSAREASFLRGELRRASHLREMPDAHSTPD